MSAKVTPAISGPVGATDVVGCAAGEGGRNSNVDSGRAEGAPVGLDVERCAGLPLSAELEASGVGTLVAATPLRAPLVPQAATGPATNNHHAASLRTSTDLFFPSPTAPKVRRRCKRETLCREKLRSPGAEPCPLRSRRSERIRNSGRGQSRSRLAALPDGATRDQAASSGQAWVVWVPLGSARRRTASVAGARSIDSLRG